MEGRFAGRIKNAQFQLNGKTIRLDQNHGKHHLHGGKYQLSNVAWNFENYNEETNTLNFSYVSKANEFYPGDVTIEVAYTLTDENELNIKYKATTTEDTLLNLTNHAYFNLDGNSGNTLDQKLQINEFYPGDVTIEVAYTLTDENELNIKYKATTTEDTLLNLPIVTGKHQG